MSRSLRRDHYSDSAAPAPAGQRQYVQLIPSTSAMTIYIENVSTSADSGLVIGDWWLFVEN